MSNITDELFFTAVSVKENTPTGWGHPVPAVRIGNDIDFDCFSILESDLEPFIEKLKTTMAEAKAFVLEQY
jgi:hypothetical protein